MQQMRTFYLIHPEDRTYVGKTLSKLLDKPQETITVQYRYQTKRGEYICWRGDKNYQSKAGQAFQGVELKKIEG